MFRQDKDYVRDTPCMNPSTNAL